MIQERLNDLAILSIENELARQVNFDELIDTFASRKARKAIYIIHIDSTLPLLVISI